jgi:hypothetical protein
MSDAAIALAASIPLADDDRALLTAALERRSPARATDQRPVTNE